MNIYNEIWFWMMIVGLLSFAFGIIIYSNSKDSITGVPWWAYFFLILGAILLIISLLISFSSYYNQRYKDIIKNNNLPSGPETVITTLSGNETLGALLTEGNKTYFTSLDGKTILGVVETRSPISQFVVSNPIQPITQPNISPIQPTIPISKK
jgi:hypothetical protein